MAAHRILTSLIIVAVLLLAAATAVQVHASTLRAAPLEPTGEFTSAEQDLLDELRSIFELPSSAEDLRSGVPRQTVLAADGALIESAAELCTLEAELEAAGLDPRDPETVHGFGHSIAKSGGLDDEAGEAAYLAYLDHCAAR